jgi:ribose 5-phosphate isomerase A
VTIAQCALNLVESGNTVGLGTGRAAVAFIEALGAACRAGLAIRGVATSQSSAELAGRLGIPLVSLGDVDSIDIAIDGADEVDPGLNLIKGRGGALLREKVVASAAKRFVILVGAEKLVETLGERGYVPVEVVPFAAEFCRRRIERLGHRPALRLSADKAGPFRTDNENFILDCHVDRIEQPLEFEYSIRSIPGVVTSGLFLGMADRVFIDDGSGIRVLDRESGPKTL